MLTYCLHHMFEQEASKRSCHGAFRSSIRHCAKDKQPAAKQKVYPSKIQRSYLCLFNLLDNMHAPRASRNENELAKKKLSFL